MNDGYGYVQRPPLRPMPQAPASRIGAPATTEPRKESAARKRTSAQDPNASIFIDLYAEGSEYVIKHPGFTLDAAGNAEFSGDLSAASGTFSGTLDAVDGTFDTITAGVLQNAAGTVYIDLGASGAEKFIEHPEFSLTANGIATFSGDLSAATGTFAGSLSAASGTFAGTLSAVDGTFDTITAGLLQNAAGTRYIDLGATTTEPFIKHDAFELLADGSATFSGALSAASGTFSGEVTASAIVASDSFTASNPVFDGEVIVKGGRAYSSVRLLPDSIEVWNSGLQKGLDLASASGDGFVQGGGALFLDATSDIHIGQVADIGVYGATPVGRQTVTGSRGGNAALASLITALATQGWVTDSTTA